MDGCAMYFRQTNGNVNKLKDEMKIKEKIMESQNQEISQLKEDMKSLIQSMKSLKEYCLELQKIGEDQQKILEEVCKENIEIKKELRELRDSKNISVSNPPNNFLPPLPSLSQLIKI